jgi:hypothetical protein
VGGEEVVVVVFRDGGVIDGVEGVIVGVTVLHTQRNTGWNAQHSAGNGCEKIKVVLSHVRTAVKGYGKYGTMFFELQYSKRQWRPLQRLQKKMEGCPGMPSQNSSANFRLFHITRVTVIYGEACFPIYWY